MQQVLDTGKHVRHPPLTVSYKNHSKYINIRKAPKKLLIMIATISLGQGSEIGLLHAALQMQSASILRKCQLMDVHGAFIPLLIAGASSPHFNLLAHFLM